MKILHVITSLHTGGAEKLMVDLLPRFREMGAEVDLALFDGSDTPFRRRVEENGIKIIDFGQGGSVYNPLHIFRLARLMKKYDIVHTHNYAPQLFGAIGSVLCSVVLCTTEHTTSNRRRGWKWYAPIDRWMYSRYKRIICISDKTEKNLRTFINTSDSKFITVNNGIDVKSFTTAQPSGFLSRSIPAGAKTIIQVARFGWEKDQDTTIRAMKYLPDNFRLFLVGNGNRRALCEQIALDEGIGERVCFLGIRNDVPELLKESDYIVVSSHVEGFGLVAAEGMASGHPVIASDVDGLREVVQGAGILFPHGDSEALAREILRLEENPEEYNAVAARCAQRAARFDIATMATAYMKQYEKLMTDEKH